MAILEESAVPGSRVTRLAMSSIGQQRKTKRCPPTPRLDGKRVLVTGGTNGIGIEIARGVLARGADVILPCRNPQKGARVRDELRQNGNGRVDLVAMDLADLRSVREGAPQITAAGGRIDVLIENAGVWERKYSLTPQGHEISFGINVLGHFLLRQLLLDAGLLAGARVVVVTGDIYVLEKECTPDFTWQGSRGGMRAYCRSKLGNLWIAAELQKRHPELTVYVVHPGAIDTDLGGKAGPIAGWVKRNVMIDADLGAQTPLICATQEGLERGAYYHNSFGLMRLPATDAARNSSAAAELWVTCEKLVAGR